MPGYSWHPPVALMGPFDARPWSGSNVISFSGTPVALSSYTTGEGYYEDVVAFLNGFGSRNVAASRKTLGGELNQDWTGGASTITAGIDSSDKVYIESSAVDFAITSSSGLSALGFSSSTYAVVGGGAPFRRTAEGEWTRGNISDITIEVDPSGAGAAYSVKTATIQSVPTWIRAHNEGDADEVNPTQSLERRLQDVLTSYTMRCCLDAYGRVVISWRTTAGHAAPTWPSATFAARLGFRGNETRQTSGGVYYVRATYPCPGVLVSVRGLAAPLAQVHRWEGSVIRQTNGIIASNKVADFWKYEIPVEVTGPTYQGAPEAEGEDLEKHFFHNVNPYMPPGEPLNLYQHWGDPRRRLLSSGVTSSVAAYGTLYTSERNGDIGRLRMRRSADDTGEHAVRYQSALRNLATVRVMGELRTSD